MGKFLDERGDESLGEWLKRNITHNVFRVAMSFVDRDLAKIRAGLDKRMGRTIAQLQVRDPELEITQHRARQVYFEIIQPGGVSADAPLIMYLHGGGYCIGSAHAYRQVVTGFARKFGTRIALVDYRLAPENPFPAALDDAHSVYLWLCDKMGVAPMLMGDSAGGGLVLALMMRLRDQGKPLPDKAVCLSPWTDLTCSGDSLEINDPYDYLLTAADTREKAHHYVGDNDPRNPLISPVFGDFKGLPETFLFASDKEILLDDSTRVFQKASADGMPIKMHIYQNMQHVWPLPFPHLAESKRVLKEIRDFFQG